MSGHRTSTLQFNHGDLTCGYEIAGLGKVICQFYRRETEYDRPCCALWTHPQSGAPLTLRMAGTNIMRCRNCLALDKKDVRVDKALSLGDITQARNVAQQVLAGTVDRVELGYVVKNLTEILGDGEDE